MKCRVYDSPCIHPAYCAEQDACCAGDPNCKSSNDPVTVKRCEVRNGRRYEDGVDVGPADPGSDARTQNSQRRGGRKSHVHRSRR